MRRNSIFNDHSYFHFIGWRSVSVESIEVLYIFQGSLVDAVNGISEATWVINIMN